MKQFFLKILRSKPSMYSKSFVLNVLGMHWFRILFFYVRRVARIPKYIAPPYAKYLRELEEHGIVVIPNFFSNEDFSRFRKEFEDLRPYFERDTSEILLPHVDRLSLRDRRVSDFTKNLFLENALIAEIARDFLNREYHLPWQGFMTRIYINQEELNLPKNGGTNNLHFDAPLRVLKFFYYVSDTDEENAAFTYCRGTQKRNSLKRLWFEYVLSLRYVRNRNNSGHKGEYLDGEPWVTVKPEEIDKYKLYGAPVAGKANTLVIANTGGFHKRGAFQKPGLRETVEINFRDAETLRNDFFSLEKKIKESLGRSGKTALAPKAA